jgi:hypothetical protein
MIQGRCHQSRFYEYYASLVLGAMAQMILKRAKVSRPSGQWRDDDYDVIEDGVVVGRIFLVPTGPEGRPWMWARGHNGSGPFFIVFWVGNRADA